MRVRRFLPLLFLCGGVMVLDAWTAPPPDYPLTPVSYAQVDITDAFWSQRIEVNRTKSIQHVFARSEERGGSAPAQLIEAAAYMLAT